MTDHERELIEAAVAWAECNPPCAIDGYAWKSCRER